MTDCPACRGAGAYNAPFGCGGRCCFQRCAACAGTGTLRLARVGLTKRSAAARTAALDRWQGDPPRIGERFRLVITPDPIRLDLQEDPDQ